MIFEENAAPKATEETQVESKEEATQPEEVVVEEPPVQETPVEETNRPDAKDLEIEALKKERNELLYTLADAQNIVRRTRAQAEQDRKFASEGLIREILPVLDGFERTMAMAAKGASVESLTDGVRVMEKQLRKALESSGVTRVAALGAAFDPEVHEALATVENEELDADTIVDEIEAGYTMHEKVIRAARVRVTVKP
jgi:molecular chaperone GrpE